MWEKFKEISTYPIIFVVVFGLTTWEHFTKCRHRKTYYTYEKVIGYINKYKTCKKCGDVIGVETITEDEYKRLQRQEKFKRILN